MLPAVRRGLLLGPLLVLGACHVYMPMDASVRPPVAGEMLSFDVTDRGRVGLAERFGAGVMRIEGRLTRSSEAAYELQVYRVAHIRDGESQWNGEAVTLSRDFVGGVQERKFSRGKTIVAGTAFVGALAAFIITRKLISSGREEIEGGPGPGPEQIRWIYQTGR